MDNQRILIPKTIQAFLSGFTAFYNHPQQVYHIPFFFLHNRDTMKEDEFEIRTENPIQMTFGVFPDEFAKYGFELVADNYAPGSAFFKLDRRKGNQLLSELWYSPETKNLRIWDDQGHKMQVVYNGLCPSEEFFHQLMRNLMFKLKTEEKCIK